MMSGKKTVVRIVYMGAVLVQAGKWRVQSGEWRVTGKKRQLSPAIRYLPLGGSLGGFKFATWTTWRFMRL